MARISIRSNSRLYVIIKQYIFNFKIIGAIGGFITFVIGVISFWNSMYPADSPAKQPRITFHKSMPNRELIIANRSQTTAWIKRVFFKSNLGCIDSAYTSNWELELNKILDETIESIGYIGSSELEIAADFEDKGNVSTTKETFGPNRYLEPNEKIILLKIGPKFDRKTKEALDKIDVDIENIYSTAFKKFTDDINIGIVYCDENKAHCGAVDEEKAKVFCKH